MKRKLMYNDSRSIYAAPALESTLLLETGGLEDVNQIGELKSTNISAAVSSGTRTLQYNRYFWNKELFSFNYSNNAIGIAIAYYRADTSSYCFCIYPILLPRVAMTLAQSITNSVTDDPQARTLLMQELVYYLNMGFTSYGVGNQYGFVAQGVGFRMAPWVTAIDAKGSPYNPVSGDMINNNRDLPIFLDGANPPPLVWTYSGNNNQLCLVINQNFPLFLNGDRIGFQIITLENYMADSPYVSDPTYITGFRPSLAYYTALGIDFNHYPPASYGDGKGWCCEGAFATGFGQSASYSSFENSQQSPTTYTDIYSPDERFQLWQATKFPQFTPNLTTIASFSSLCQQFKLVTNTGNGGTGILVSKFITSLLPSRFFSIESDALTRNQKRPLVSNNPTMGPGTMAIQFLTLDSLRTWNDNTVAGLTSSAGSVLFGSRKSGVDDCSIVSLDPMQSLQTMDLVLRDEWGNTLQNYAQLQIFNTTNSYNVMGFFDGFAILPGKWFPLPAWVTPFNPIPASNFQSILINESWWCSAYQFFGFNPTSNAASDVGIHFQPHTPRSTTFSHFARVLGY